MADQQQRGVGESGRTKMCHGKRICTTTPAAFTNPDYSHLRRATLPCRRQQPCRAATPCCPRVRQSHCRRLRSELGAGVSCTICRKHRPPWS
eukprot:3936913-Prymnesium_polylepis.1